MHIEFRPIDQIKPYPGNPRVNDQAVDAVARSIEAFGFRQPVVVDEAGVVIIGHTRLKAAAKLGMTSVPCHVAEGLSADQVRALRIADNQTASISEWNIDLLGLELAGLKDVGFDLDLLGFDADQLAEYTGATASPGLTDADEVPEPPEDAITQPGDLWTLGEHRLLCGDSTNADDVNRVMDGKKAALVSTDPPYLVDYTGERPDKEGGNKGGKDWSHVYHEVDIPNADRFFRGVFTNVVRVIAPHAAIYCWHAHKRQADIDRVWQDLGILNHQQVIWVKPVAVFGRCFWHQRHEPCLMGWVKGSMPEFARDQSLEYGTVWEVNWEGKNRVVGNDHPTQKPVELFALPIRRHTKRGEVCFEPFSGSGSQLIAAQQEGRRLYAMELEPRFVDVAVQRWERYTGKKAERVEGVGTLAGKNVEVATEKTPTAKAGVKGRGK